MIDWERVAELRSEVGEEAFAEVAALFLEEVDEVIARLDATPPPQGAALAADLHFLKGSALNLGFAAFAGLCAAGEVQAGKGAAVDLPALLACYAASRADFLAGLGGPEDGG